MTDTTTESRLLAHDYRLQAADCREQSERFSNTHHKENWLKIARQWQYLAEVAESYYLGTIRHEARAHSSS